jgi:PAS domain S-box-containing protein
MTDEIKGRPIGPVDLERFHLFVNGVRDYAIYMLSPEGYVTSWNAGAQRFKGYTEAEIIGQHFSRFYTEEDRAAGKPAAALRTAAERGKFEDEGWRVRKDGSYFWASVLVDPIYESSGQLIGFAKITRDMTERKQATEALRASEEKFRLMVQGVTDYAIYMLSPAGEITDWNAGAQRFKGYTEAEAVGTHFSRFYTEEDRTSGLPAKALAIAAKEGRFESEGWRVRKDGRTFWAHVVIDAIRNQAGELLGFAKVTRDITEKRRAAEALERAKDGLVQSQKLEAIGKLTGGVAHDFNNVLAVIMNGIELLAGKLQSPADIKILDSMQRAVTRGATLNQQMLSFARQQPLRQQKCNLNQVISNFDAVLRRVCDESITFNLSLTPQLKSALIDATQFEVALLNLVTNARDAMPNGGMLTIATENVALGHNQIGTLPAGQFIKATVRDTGVGMSPEVAIRAIDPFFTTKPLGKGTGMGLSQVYGLLQQSQGDMVLETEEGNGTSISLYFPAGGAANNDELLSQEAATGNDKALIVDDQPDVLELAVELFKTFGYKTLSAGNACDALEILKRTPDIDVLFTDVVMPGMNGVTLAQEARKIIPNIKVLLTSGYTGSMLNQNNPDLQDFQLVGKPYRTADIVKLLRKAG